MRLNQAPLRVGGRGAIGPEDDAHADVVPFALDGDGRARAAAVPHEQRHHPTELALIAVDLRATAGLDRDTGLGGDFPE